MTQDDSDAQRENLGGLERSHVLTHPLIYNPWWKGPIFLTVSCYAQYPEKNAKDETTFGSILYFLKISP